MTVTAGLVHCHAILNWCHSVYACVVLIPGFLFWILSCSFRETCKTKSRMEARYEAIRYSSFPHLKTLQRMCSIFTSRRVTLVTAMQGCFRAVSMEMWSGQRYRIPTSDQNTKCTILSASVNFCWKTAKDSDTFNWKLALEMHMQKWALKRSKSFTTSYVSMQLPLRRKLLVKKYNFRGENFRELLTFALPKDAPKFPQNREIRKSFFYSRNM